LRYEGPVYRPPSEAGSLLIQATLGCPHNRCRFCAMYKNRRFRIRLLKDIFQDLDHARDCYGPGVKTLFLPDGNTIVMKTSSLVKILERARKNFPNLERITVYGSARFIFLKKMEEMKALREAGLSRIHMGFESGDDEVLRRMEKGATAAECIEAGRKVKEAGMELSVYYLLGLGGVDRLEAHARNSADVLNAIEPDFIRIRTLTPHEGTPLFQDYLQGRFVLPSPHEAMRELELLVLGLRGPFMLLSDHINNYINLTGKLPDDKMELLAEIETAMAMNDSLLAQRLTVL